MPGSVLSFNQRIRLCNQIIRILLTHSHAWAMRRRFCGILKGATAMKRSQARSIESESFKPTALYLASSLHRNWIDHKSLRLSRFQPCGNAVPRTHSTSVRSFSPQSLRQQRGWRPLPPPRRRRGPKRYHPPRRRRDRHCLRAQQLLPRSLPKQGGITQS